METVRFYFSFRSPFAWMAFHLAPRALDGLPVQVERVPVFPPPNFANDPAAVPAKLEYITQHDLPRLAEAYGFDVKPLREMDVDWMPPHAMWLYGEDEGKGDALGQELFAARFSRGESLGDPAVLSASAERVGLDAGAALEASASPTYQERVVAGMRRGLGEGVFGVPFFVYKEQRFWGQDRLTWLAREIQKDCGLPTSPPELLL